MAEISVPDDDRVEIEKLSHQALASREVIGQTEGLLTQQRHPCGARASELKMTTSQTTDVTPVRNACRSVTEHEAAMRAEVHSRR